MGCSSLICRALAGAAWSPSKVGINPSILDRIPPSAPPDREGSKKSERLLYVCLLKSTHRAFRGPKNREASISLDRCRVNAKDMLLAKKKQRAEKCFAGAKNSTLKNSTLERSSSKTFSVEKFNVENFQRRKFLRRKNSALEKVSSKTFNVEKFIVENFQR